MHQVGSTYPVHTVDAYTSVISLEQEQSKYNNAPATLTLLSFANKLCKSSAVLGAFVVAVIPAMAALIGYREVVVVVTGE